jgi:tRNA1Val (adenine37-N6)-methyltransferase
MHGQCAQKLGTDSMLLGAWAEPPADTRSVLDVGTGTGNASVTLAAG